MSAHAARARVFVGLAEITGFYAEITDGLRGIGYDADHVTLQTHPFGYREVRGRAAARAEHLSRGALRVGRRLGAGRRLVSLGVRLALLAWSAWRYDKFVFAGGGTFLRGWDLWLLRRLGRRTCCIFHGSDSRPPYLDGILSTGLSPAELRRATRRAKRFVARVERWADVVVCNPLSSHFHTKPVVILQVIGLPTAGSAPQAPPARHPPLVLHAPSDLRAKGTDRIRAAIRRLEDEGVALEYRELTGRTNSEVLDALGDAAFVIDQLYSDTTYSTFAKEAASAGRPAVIGGFGQRDLAAILPAGFVPPAQYCHPEDVEAAVRSLVADPASTTTLGEEAHAWLQEHWSAPAVAGRVAALLARTPDPGWVYDPRTLRYAYGCALSESQLRDGVRRLVSAYGTAALCLDDKPELRDRIIAVAGIPGSQPNHPT